jgi:two-component system sensor histidine kinase VanS
MLDRLETIFKSEHEFFSDAAHTLKTPLAVLQAKVEGLNKENQAKKHELLEVIDSAVDTVQDLLLISRIETGVAGMQKKVDLSEITKKLEELAKSLSEEKQVTVESTIVENITIIGDQSLIKRALGNIVHNAVQYVNKGGKIDLNLIQQRNKITFVVTNTGGNISKDEATHVFERFFKGSNSQRNIRSSGLGLAISKAVIENYNGTIKFQADSSGIVTVSVVF